MTPLERYDGVIKHTSILRQEAKRRMDAADRLEAEILAELGILHVDREPGFPCWTIKGKTDFYNSPREALEGEST